VGALIGRRLLALIPILLLVSFATFMLVALFPGDAAVTIAGGQNATAARVVEVRHELHLDDPMLEQYGRWLGGAVHLDLGRSLFSHTPVINEIEDRLPVTLSIVAAAMAVGLLLGIPLGLASGLRPNGAIDHSSRTAASIGLAVPSFWLAVELIAVLAVARRWFPPSGFVRIEDDPSGWLDHVTLPAVALGVASAASVARQLRAELIDVLDANYVRTAWAKGGRARLVVAKHALKNAAIPAVTVIGLQVGFLLGGTVVFEQIFGIPGLGTYFTQAATNQDVPVIQGVVLVFVVAQVVISLLVDITYGLLNPKVRVQ
jgi:peptide/nickel transport system permease protein